MPELELVPQLPSTARCRDCDYLLRELTVERCPECGRPFDARDHTSYHTGRPMPPWLRRWLEPIGWPTFVLAGVAWLAVSWFVADPALSYMCIGPIVLVFTIWPCLGLLLLVRMVARTSLRVRYQRTAAELGSEARRIAWITAAFAALHLSTLIALPTRLWFLPFWASFESAAAEMRAITPEDAWRAKAPMPSQVRWIGPWHVRVEGVIAQPGVVAFYTDGVGRLAGGGTGFVHVNGRDGMIGYNEGEDGWIIGDWYYFTTD